MQEIQNKKIRIHVLQLFCSLNSRVSDMNIHRRVFDVIGDIFPNHLFRRDIVKALGYFKTPQANDPVFSTAAAAKFVVNPCREEITNIISSFISLINIYKNSASTSQKPGLLANS